MKSDWKKFRYRLERFGLGLAAAIVPILPRRLCVHVANVIGWLAAHLDRSGRAVALDNLKHAFGERFTPAQCRRIARQSYQHFSRAMIDLLWSPRLTRENFRRWFEVEGLDEAMAEIEPGRSCLFATVHYGDFEWSAKAMGLYGFPLLIIAQEFKNAALDSVIEELRRWPDHEVAGRERGIIRMFKALRRGRHIGFLCDLTLRPVQPSVAIDRFGMKCCVTFAHAWLHLKTGAPIIPLHAVALPDGRCRLVVQRKIEIPPGVTETEITQLCWNRFEDVIRRDPAPWLWMYKQWRYRPTPALRVYPFYSNDSEEFDALIARHAPAPLGVEK